MDVVVVRYSVIRTERSRMAIYTSHHPPEIEMCVVVDSDDYYVLVMTNNYYTCSPTVMAVHLHAGSCNVRIIYTCSDITRKYGVI